MLQPGALAKLRAWVPTGGRGGSGEKGAEHASPTQPDGFTAVLIDINGSRDIGGVARVLAMVLHELQPAPRLIVVKSRALHGKLAALRADTVPEPDASEH